MSSKLKRQPAAVTLLVIAILAIWMILAAFPFLWTLWGSFKVEGDFFSKANWANAITGTLTIAETGDRFTDADNSRKIGVVTLYILFVNILVV